ncbi:hypothetical protein [Streptomyces sp. NPDC059076]|uniref:hypothetical protein n=1 Tax=unclassified Streptomyces TaxID=2593676 RepID=UPI0036C13FB5
MTFGYSDLIALDLGKLNTAVGDWQTMVGELAKLRTEAVDGMGKKSAAARWEGVNATVTREFVQSTAKEFGDLYTQAKSIHAVLADAHNELADIQKRARTLSEEARRGNPARAAGADPGLLVTDGGDGTVKVFPLVCDAKGTSQRTLDMMQWYADTLTALVAHAAEVDAAVTRALKAIHGNDPHNAGHASHTSLDQDQLPRAMKLAALGGDASDRQRDELRRLWQSLSPQARAQLWARERDGLLAADTFAVQSKQVSADRGAGPHGSQHWSRGDFWKLMQARGMAGMGDLAGNDDAARHMDHYLQGRGGTVNLNVDRMLTDDPALRQVTQDTVDDDREKWRQQALKAFEESGGQPVAIPIESQPQSYSHKDRNWYLAVGSAMTNTTGVVTVTPDSTGQPRVELSYQVNVWDRYNWDPGKVTPIAGTEVTDADMARLHTTGLAQEYNLRGSGSVQHYDLGSTERLPKPREAGEATPRFDSGRSEDRA